MQFLIRVTGKKAKAHIWHNDDTLCRMWSTGGLKATRYALSDSRGEHEVCHMCNLKLCEAEYVAR